MSYDTYSAFRIFFVLTLLLRTNLGDTLTQPMTADDVREAQNDIATHGLTAEVIEVLEQLGETEVDIDRIQQDLIALDDPDAVAALGGGTFPQVLVDQSVIDATRQAADALKQFVRCDDGDTEQSNNQDCD